MTSEPGSSTQTSGWLSKWTNIIGGYQKRWFVLSNGMLCYYKNQAEMTHACRGTISLSGATIDSDETCKFVISHNGYAYHVKADNQEDKQRWIEALTSARDAASIDTPQSLPLDECHSTTFNKRPAIIRSMKQKLEDIRTCVCQLKKRGKALQTSISTVDSSTEIVLQESSHQWTAFQEVATSTINSCSDYLDIAEFHFKQWLSMYPSEEDQMGLAYMVKSLTQKLPPSQSHNTSDDEAEYYDCSDMPEIDSAAVNMQVYQAVNGSPGPSSKRARRTRIPDRPNVSASLWAILKNCVGKDLTKMPLPVAFAEPLSLLQRLTEDFEYAHVLDKASECHNDVPKQVAHIAAFVASAYSTTIGRTGKPFNPLLGETYECDRSADLGWRSIAEQVSHHPPVAGIYCEGKSWEVWSEESMQTKFRGATLHIFPQGESHLKFTNGNRYSWKKPATCIHNLIVGKLWVEQEGDVEIKCFTSDITCKLSFITAGWFGEMFSVKGLIKDGAGNALLEISGKYSTQIEYKPAGVKESAGTVVWTRTEPPKDSSKYYNFTLLSCQLNEMEANVAPTDSRRRPDQRLMEEGKFDDANAMKKKLEDWQRTNKKPTWKPNWFVRQPDPDTRTEMWTYNKEYWPCKDKQDWSRCPSYIFTPPS